MKHTRPTQSKNIEDHLKDLCKIYRGEEDNPHDVDSQMGEERAIQFLKYHLWDAERSILENPGEWRYLVLEDYGSLPCDLKAAARRIYDYAVRQKLERIKEFGFDLTEIYERLTKQEADQ